MLPRVRSGAEIEAERARRREAEMKAEEERAKAEAEEEDRKRALAQGGLLPQFRKSSEQSSSSSAALPSAATVGDGGAGWRARALKRARERAAEEGKNDEHTSRERMSEAENERAPRRGEWLPGGGSTSHGRTDRVSARMMDDARRLSPGGSAGMEIVETEEEIEAREHKAQQERERERERERRNHGLRPDISRMMKRPSASPVSSPPTPSNVDAGSAATASSSSSWREKVRSTLTGTAASKTPEGATARLFSTPNTAATAPHLSQPTPSPLPSPSPSPPPRRHDGVDTQRFAGMLSPQRLGMDNELGVVMEEASPSASPAAAESPDALPSFAASYEAAAPTAAAIAPSDVAAAAAAPSTQPIPPLPKGASDAEINKLAAQAQVAKLKKQTALYEQLTAKIAELREANRLQREATAQAGLTAPTQHPPPPPKSSAATRVAASHESLIDAKLQLIRSSADLPTRTTTEAGHEVVVLPSHDAHGRPVHSPSAAAAAASSDQPQRDPTMKNKRLAPTISGGERKGYFADDVKDVSLRDLVEREKLAAQAAAMGGAAHASLSGSAPYQSIDRDYARNIMRDSHWKSKDLDEQFDEADFDMSKYDRSTSLRAQKRSVAEQQKRERSMQIRQHDRQQTLIERCWYCLGASKEVLKSLIISIGVRVFLSIPRVDHLVSGHCVLAPIEHILSQAQASDEVNEEIAYFKSHLHKMYGAEKPARKPIFMETVHHLGQQRHMVVHCVPLPLAAYQEAEAYFTKAVEESDEEWTQNKKLIRFRQDKGGIKRAVPPNFEYFSVEFGISDGGIAHVIEDHTKFPKSFGGEVICGILEQPSQLLIRGKRAGAAEESRRVKAFIQAWSKYDWTQRLEGGSKHQTSTNPMTTSHAARSSMGSQSTAASAAAASR